MIAKCCRKRPTDRAAKQNPPGRSKSKTKFKPKQGEKSSKDKQTHRDDDPETTSAIAIALDLSWEEEWGVDSDEPPSASADPDGLGADLVQSIVRRRLSIVVTIVS